MLAAAAAPRNATALRNANARAIALRIAIANQNVTALQSAVARNKQEKTPVSGLVFFCLIILTLTLLDQ